MYTTISRFEAREIDKATKQAEIDAAYAQRQEEMTLSEEVGFLNASQPKNTAVADAFKQYREAEKLKSEATDDDVVLAIRREM